MCHPGHISRNKKDRQVLKKSKGRPYETSCNIFCNSVKQNYVYKSPKHIDLFTIQAVMCHTDDILRNKSDLRILNKSQGRVYFVTVLNKLTSTLELITFEILAAERLRLLAFGNRLIIDCFANIVKILIWQFSTIDRFKSEKYESITWKIHFQK